MSADLVELVHRLGRPRILVVGDIILDRYVWGNAERISQEAPVALLRADSREHRLGGAGSVSTMLAALNAQVVLAGAVGSDDDGRVVRQELERLGVDADCVLVDPTRPTTVKERYIGRAQQRHPQQMLRVDYEVRDPLCPSAERQLADGIRAKLASADIVLVSDYEKGVCTPGLLEQVTSGGMGRGLRVVADPIRGHDYSRYRGMSAVTPNRLEAGLSSGMAVSDGQVALEAGGVLVERLGLEAAIVTLDKEGMALAHRDGRRLLFPTRPRQVYDITGAGDMVLAVIGMALAAGADYDRAIRLANVAGGLEVEKIGVATVTREEILRDLLVHEGASADKVRGRRELGQLLAWRRELGDRVAFTNGCFDLLHVGHVRYLQQARRQGDLLVVGVNSDRSIRALKGPDRPINSEQARAAVLAGLEAVGYVVIFDEETPDELIRELRPDVLVKGADYRLDEVVGREFVESYGGRVVLADLVEGVSTTRLIADIQSQLAGPHTTAAARSGASAGPQVPRPGARKKEAEKRE